MLDSLINDYFKGEKSCVVEKCVECPLIDYDCDCCYKAAYIFDIYRTIGKLSKEHKEEE